MLTKLTHPEPNYELWVNLDDIVIMERYTHPQSVIITTNTDKPSVTALVMKNGKTMACKETPAEIMSMIEPL